MNNIDLLIAVNATDGKAYVLFNDDISLRTYNTLTEQKRTNVIVKESLVSQSKINISLEDKCKKDTNSYIYFNIAKLLDDSLGNLFGKFYGDFIQKHTLTLRIFTFGENNTYTLDALEKEAGTRQTKSFLKLNMETLKSELSIFYESLRPTDITRDEFEECFGKDGLYELTSWENVHGYQLNLEDSGDIILFKPFLDFEDKTVFDEYRSIIRKRHER